MDNELEIMNNEAMTGPVEVVGEPSVLSTIAPIAGGMVIGVGLGFALCKWVINPLLEKRKAKKAAEKTEEPKSEE